MKTLDKLRAALAAIKRTRDNRVEIWRVLVDVGPNGEAIEIARIYRGSFIAPPAPKED